MIVVLIVIVMIVYMCVSLRCASACVCVCVVDVLFSGIDSTLFVRSLATFSSFYILPFYNIMTRTHKKKSVSISMCFYVVDG